MLGIDPRQQTAIGLAQISGASTGVEWRSVEFKGDGEGAQHMDRHSSAEEQYLDDQFIERYLEKLIRNKEPFVTASKAIDRWERKDSGQFVLQALACGLIAALAGGWFAVVQ